MTPQEGAPDEAVKTLRVQRGRDRDDDAPIQYRGGADGWYVKTPEDDEFWLFADETASARTFRQLARKKWDYNYGDPDPFDDRS